jgi:proton-dependent oligopeptide transporter, POT family
MSGDRVPGRLVAGAPAASASAELFGHPRGLAFLFATEMWERFSYYGMRALLVLYMVRYLLEQGRADNALGFPLLRSMLERFSGPLEPQPLASQIYGLYTAFVYLTPVFGGLLADRILGQRRTVIIGAVLMAMGHFMMAFESLFLLALVALILGNGAFKPNISTQVGSLYAPGDTRRDRAYIIFYVGINLGAFLAPLICGTLGEEAGWQYGFAAAGIGMLIGISVYVMGRTSLPADALRAPAAKRDGKRPSDMRTQVLTLMLLCAPVALFWAGYEQQGNTVVLWADDYSDRSVDLLVWRGMIPTTWFQAVNPFLIFAFTPFIVRLWARQAKRHAEPSPIAKMALGCGGLAVANLIMALAAWWAGDGKASWLWLLAYFVVLTIGELYLSPSSLSLVSRLAPPVLLSTMMGIWLGTSFAGNLLAGWIGSYWSEMGKAAFFLMIAALAAAAGLAVQLLGSSLRARLVPP